MDMVESLMNTRVSLYLFAIEKRGRKIVPGGGAIGKRGEENGDESIEQTKLRLKEARKRTKGYLNISHVFFLGSRRIIREGSST